MKRHQLSFLFFLLISTSLFAQSPIVNTIKAYPLKDYQSPDIKYRTLDLGASFKNSADYQKEISTTNLTFRLNSDLYFYKYSFSEKYQGISTSNLRLDLSSLPRKKDSVKYKSNYVSTYLDYFTQSRIYYPNDVFWGLHSGSYYQFDGAVHKYEDEIHHNNLNDLSLTPYFSLGKGRVQPVRSARTAMDILISLNKYGRLKHEPSIEEIDALAIVANEIVYKRFYDFRFKNIYQLEELDKSLQSMDLVDTADIVYFANLNDIWEYGNWQKRGSGSRFEGGFIPTFSGLYQDSDYSLSNSVRNSKYLNYGTYGFLSYNRFVPVNYAWQSDLFVDVTFGMEWEEEKQFNSDTANYINTYSNGKSLNGMLNINWEIAYYPNTRTRFALSPFCSLSFIKANESDGSFGINSGVNFSTYYYVSPRFRISALFNFYYYDDFSLKTPFPFWNSYLYNNANEYRVLNDVVTTQNFLRENNQPSIGYYLSFGISYAIF